jgi:hypothetical protein
LVQDRPAPTTGSLPNLGGPNQGDRHRCQNCEIQGQNPVKHQRRQQTAKGDHEQH